MFRRFLSRIQLKLGALSGRRGRDIAEELRAHVDQIEDEYLASGMSHAEARKAARRRFGNDVQIRETSRSLFAFRFLDDLSRDVRVAVRTLARSPGFTATAILTLAIGVGGTAAVFSIVDGTLLQPLPYDEAGRLVIVDVEEPGTTGNLSVSTFETLRQRFESLDLWAASATGTAESDANGPIEIHPFENVYGDYFETFGLRPVVGRLFGPGEELTNGTRPAVISRELWLEKWNGSEDVVGQPLRVRSTSGAPLSFTIVGVLGSEFRNPVRGTPRTDFWTPPPGTDLELDLTGSLRTVARMAQEADVSLVRTELEAISSLLTARFPDRDPSTVLRVTPVLDSVVRGDARRMMTIFAMAAGTVFLIGIVNLVHLQGARVAERGRELAIRSALGASRTALLRQVTVETVLVSVTGAATAYGLLAFFEPVLLNNAPAIFPRSSEVAIDGRVLFFAVAVALVAGLIVGVIPALNVSRSDPRSSLHGETPAATEGRLRIALRNLLMLTETAMAIVLLVGAGLLIQSFMGMRAVDVGMDPSGLTTATVVLPTSYDDDERDQLAREIVDSLRRDPRVESVAFANNIPMQGLMAAPVEVESGERQSAHIQVIGDDYGAVTGTQLLRGRWIDGDDLLGSRQVVVVSESAADRYWLARDPLGRPLRRLGDDAWHTVVGLVEDVYVDYDQEPAPTVYFPLGTSYLSFLGQRFTIAARLRGGPAEILEEHTVVLEPRSDVTLGSLEESLHRAVRQERIQTTAMSTLAALAVGLAILGVYGVVAYATTQRIREIGVRMALGGSVSAVVWHMVRRSAAPAFAGIAVGIGGAVLLSRFLEAYLYEMDPTAPLPYVIVAAGGAVLILIASWIPARRAAHVDPVSILRHQ